MLINLFSKKYFCFFKAFSLGYCISGVCILYGSAGWLVRLLLLFSSTVSAPVLYWFWLRHISGAKKHLWLDFMICASKSDKLSKTAVQNNCAMIADELDIEANIIPFSSLKGDGVSLLMDIIKERCDVDYGQSEKGN